MSVYIRSNKYWGGHFRQDVTVCRLYRAGFLKRTGRFLRPMWSWKSRDRLGGMTSLISSDLCRQPLMAPRSAAKLAQKGKHLWDGRRGCKIWMTRAPHESWELGKPLLYSPRPQPSFILVTASNFTSTVQQFPSKPLWLAASICIFVVHQISSDAGSHHRADDPHRSCRNELQDLFTLLHNQLQNKKWKYYWDHQRCKSAGRETRRC